ncbi:hypothetical protein HEQ63_02820 [Haematospirillum jordaniae]|uniref:hypothetical protein n=1 Tax=Haematospirillum jordaniae TaxID=1549855 RepID=UPI00143319D8|nr:hypothetical protein [Haematospirillum jordaniae]NKD85121.1 hypothetical protein [Haematospirillum jordaniae]
MADSSFDIAVPIAIMPSSISENVGMAFGLDALPRRPFPVYPGPDYRDNNV